MSRRIVKTWSQSMSDKIKEIQAKLAERFKSGGQASAACSYIPLVGWIYPYFFRKEDELSKFHAEQAMQLNILTLTLYFAIWILEYFPITAIFFGPGSILYPISRTLWLLVIFAYIAFSTIGAYQAYSATNWEIPYLKKIVTVTITYIKGLRKSS